MGRGAAQRASVCGARGEDGSACTCRGGAHVVKVELSKDGLHVLRSYRPCGSSDADQSRHSLLELLNVHLTRAVSVRVAEEVDDASESLAKELAELNLGK